MFTSKCLASKLRDGKQGKLDGISIVPMPDGEIDNIEHSGESAIDLRLGRWFVALRQARIGQIRIMEAADSTEQVAKTYFRPFGEDFVVHPGRFVLGITLEWISLPPDIGAYVTGKSSLGRRGLVIETAAGIHPGFSGCLALELANVGEVPLVINPGMRVAQMFPHATVGDAKSSQSEFNGKRKPVLGHIARDGVFSALKKGH
jgi:dCTP deaminase